MCHRDDSRLNSDALTGLLRKEQATREMLSRQITDLRSVPPTRLSRRKSPPSTRHAKKEEDLEAGANSAKARHHQAIGPEAPAMRTWT